MIVLHRTLWATALAVTLVAASCQVSIPGVGNIVLGPSAQPTETPTPPPTDTPAPPLPTPTPELVETPTPPPTETPLPTPTPEVTPTETPSPTVEAVGPTPTATLSLVELTPETGWPVAPVTLALLAGGGGLVAIILGWLLRKPSG